MCVERVVLTEVQEVCVLHMADLVEATIKVGGVFWQGWDLIQVCVLAVHTPTNTHTQQAGGHTCTQMEGGDLTQ